MLHKAHPEISLTGYFDEVTEKALKETQSWTNQEANGIFDLENGG
jgi:peptidoglycan hydrolase-like protein with peptidoglycan-binding domain